MAEDLAVHLRNKIDAFSKAFDELAKTRNIKLEVKHTTITNGTHIIHMTFYQDNITFKEVYSRVYNADSFVLFAKSLAQEMAFLTTSL